MVAHDGVHHAVERLLPLLDGLDEPVGALDVLANEAGRLLLGQAQFTGFLLAAAVVGQHLLVAVIDAQVGRVAGR